MLCRNCIVEIQLFLPEPYSWAVKALRAPSCWQVGVFRNQFSLRVLCLGGCFPFFETAGA